ATMFYGIIDTQSSQLFYACASSPHPIILRKASGKAETLDGSGIPLGVGMNLYITNATRFGAGDTLLLSSDALTETPDAAGKFITEENIMSLLQTHCGAPPEVIKEELLSYFRKHVENALDDDLTIAVCARIA